MYCATKSCGDDGLQAEADFIERMNNEVQTGSATIHAKEDAPEHG
jgi:hypothetical protein